MSDNKDVLRRYQELISNTAIYPSTMGVAYCALGLAGEAGEISNKVKKLYRDQRLLEAKLTGESAAEKVILTSKTDIKKELGDCLWYIVALAQEFDLSLEEIMEENIEKLLGRRERGTLQGSGDNR